MKLSGETTEAFIFGIILGIVLEITLIIFALSVIK